MEDEGSGFFFSSRRRHTRWPRDWSSDVCSSDLAADERRLRLPTGAVPDEGGRAVAEGADRAASGGARRRRRPLRRGGGAAVGGGVRGPHPAARLLRVRRVPPL